MLNTRSWEFSEVKDVKISSSLALSTIDFLKSPSSCLFRPLKWMNLSRFSLFVMQ